MVWGGLGGEVLGDFFKDGGLGEEFAGAEADGIEADGVAKRRESKQEKGDVCDQLAVAWVSNKVSGECEEPDGADDESR